MKRIQAVLDILDSKEDRQVHDATMHLLATTGVQFPEEHVLARFAAGQAKVDQISGVVQIPESLVEDTLE